MKKVLILAYDFPPFVSVGGLRPAGWAKYLQKENILPVVITRHWDDLDGTFLDYIRPSIKQEVELFTFNTHMEYRVPFSPSVGNKILLKYNQNRLKRIRSFFNVFHEIGQYFLPIGNKRSLYKQARKVLQTSNDFDLILATGDPFVLFHYAMKLKKEFNIPCIIDYRDPWSQDVYLQNRPLLMLINRNIEIRTLKSINHITTVSNFLVEKLRHLHGNKNYNVIPNGFDLESAENSLSIEQEKDILSIAFIGTICAWYPIELFLQTLYELKKNNQLNFKLNLIGIDQVAFIQDLIHQKFQLIDENVVISTKIANSELFEYLAKNNVLILFNSFSFLGTKIFDYLAVNRKILLLFTDDETTNQLKKKHFRIEENSTFSNALQEDLLIECNAGIAVKNPDHLKSILLELNSELITNKEIKNYTTGIEQYSRQAQAKKLAKLIYSIT